MTNRRNIEKMQTDMASIRSKFSPTMCAAKWLQTTITLYNGHTHSCHHPSPHKIPLEEIAQNPSAIHNTAHKKAARAEMLDGNRPKECQYCWNIEDLAGNHISDRTYKSTTQWSLNFLDRIEAAGADGNVIPSYLEVAFDNTCNFKCAYCSPDVSSKWMEEIEQHGVYPTSTPVGDLDWLKSIGRFPIPQREHNPYTEAFWKWWPEIKGKLHTFRITGGEPLLSKHTWRVLEDIRNDSLPDLSFSINTNMGVPETFIDRLIDAYNTTSPMLKKFTIYTSAEAAGKQADYIRYGMEYEKFMINVRRFLRETPTTSHINFMITFNALSVTSFERFLRDIYRLRCEFNPSRADNRVPLMINYLRWPQFQEVRVLPTEIRQQTAEKLKTAIRSYDQSQNGCFYLEEIDQINRLCSWMCDTELDDVERHRKDFGRFFLEYDKRRNTDFRATFPELTPFFEECIQ